MRILVAEDDPTSSSILTALLTRWGYEPITVDNGSVAWEIMQQSDAPQMALIDWEMPGLEGVEVCRRIQGRDNTNPPYLIMLTSKGESASIVMGLDAGANDYITKPYNHSELQARLRTGIRMMKLQTELVEAKEALAHKATHDYLTGVLNRAGVLNGLERELKRTRRNNSTLSIGLCDIDHFKQVNDHYGHQVGDQVLQSFVAALIPELRDDDLLGRFGGEEFLIVASCLVSSHDQGLYERLRKKVEKLSFPVQAQQFSITMSVGVADTDGNTTADALLAEADAALYRAKKAGRNRIEVAFSI